MRFKVGQVLISDIENDNPIIRITEVDNNFYRYFLIKASLGKTGKTYRDRVELINELFRPHITYNSIWSQLNG